MALNYIYYASVDIVDVAMAQYLFYEHDLFTHLKYVLNEIVKRDIDYFVKVLYKYDYPTITDVKQSMKFQSKSWFNFNYVFNKGYFSN